MFKCYNWLINIIVYIYSDDPQTAIKNQTVPSDLNETIFNNLDHSQDFIIVANANLQSGYKLTSQVNISTG